MKRSNRNTANVVPPAAPIVTPVVPLSDAEAVARVIALCERLRSQGLIIQTMPTRDTLPAWVEGVIGQLMRDQQELVHLRALLKSHL